MNCTYELTDKVRDYECDLQGIVNNANYQHYFEHARHEYLLSKGVSFSDMHDKGQDAVVARVETSYKVPLRSGDEYLSQLNVTKEGVKYVFKQAIYRKADHKLSVRGKAEIVLVINGKLTAGTAELDQILLAD